MTTKLALSAGSGTQEPVKKRKKVVLIGLVVAGTALVATAGGYAWNHSREVPVEISSAPMQNPEPAVVEGSAADPYCHSVDDFIGAAKKALADPMKADTAALQSQAKDLATQASQLAGQLTGDPDAINQAQRCTQKLQEFNRS